MMNLWGKSLVLLMLSSGASGLYSQEHFAKTNVCEVLNRGMANHAVDVEVNANVISDGRHGAILTDEKCPGRGLLLGIFPSDADPSVAAFEKTLWSDGAPGTTGREVKGTFFGRLELDHKKKRISIAITRVENLVNVRTAEKLN